MTRRPFRGWRVEYGDGTIIHEGQKEWREIPKVGIKTLSLLFDGREWYISDKSSYLQKKRGSAVPGDPNSFRIESRSIGYFDGSKKVWYTVNEFTGRMRLVVEGK